MLKPPEHLAPQIKGIIEDNNLSAAERINRFMVFLTEHVEELDADYSEYLAKLSLIFHQAEADRLQELGVPVPGNDSSNRN